MNIRKSFELTRFKFAVVVIVVALLAGTFLRFVDMIQASMEEMSVQINLISMQQMLRDQSYMAQGEDKQCSYLNNPELFLFVSSQDVDPAKSTENPGSWNYNSKTHQLTYTVTSTRYFRSKIGQKIVLDLYCNKGIVALKKNPYQWCTNKRIWGCGDW